MEESSKPQKPLRKSSTLVELTAEAMQKQSILQHVDGLALFARLESEVGCKEADITRLTESR
jgi:hypothetical protein